MEPENGKQAMKETTADNKISVMIYEPTEMGCQLLCRVLEQSSYGLKVVGSSTSSKITPESPLHSADIALISAHLSEGQGSGFRLLRDIKQAVKTVRCIMLLDSNDREPIIEAFSSGALGVCRRDESTQVLCKCIDRVYRGQIWANSEQLRYVLEALWAGARIRLTDARGNVLLSKREEEIVLLVAEGLRNREIAAQLKLSEHTIRNYLFRVFDKLGISNRSELILYFMEHQRRSMNA